MVKLAGKLHHLESCRILVAGDLVLDTYTIGKAKRISPEAPVAIIQVQSEESRPGGAGNVILNLVSLGAAVSVLGRVGNDHFGELLQMSLAKEGVDVKGIFTEMGFPTPVKNRIIAENQQIVRVDYEQVIQISESLEQKIMVSIPDLLQEIDIIAISDYGKGFLSKSLLSTLITQAQKKGIKVIVDPKGIDFSKYSGATIIKPNLSEAFAAANLPDGTLEEVADRIFKMVQIELLIITRSEAGVSLFHKNGTREDFPVKIREIKDVTGAGDTVLAMFTFAVANGLSYPEAAQLSNVAAGIAIEHFGCARITLSELAKRLLEDNVVNKVFDEEHVFALQEVLKGRQYSLLGIVGSQGLTTTIFHAIRQLSQKENWDLILYVKDSDPDESFITMLASLRDVDFIIIKSESLRSLCTRIKPDAVYSMEGTELQKLVSLDHFFEEVTQKS